MRHFIWLLLAIMIHGCGCPGVMAQSPTSLTNQNVYEFLNVVGNYVLNPYARLNTLGVTGTASFSRDNTTDKLYGYASHVCDGASQGQYCEYELKPITAPDTNGRCEFAGVWKGDASLYRAQILDSSGVLVSQTPVVLGNSTAFGGASSWGSFSVKASCQASPKIRITQTESGNGAAIKLGLKYSKISNFAEVAQSYKVGSVTITGCATTWSTTSSTYVNATAVSGCTYAVTGEVIAPATNIPGFRLNYVRPGSYQFFYRGARYKSTTNPGIAGYRISDGTNFTPPSPMGISAASDLYAEGFTGELSYTAGSLPAGPVTIQVQMSISGTNTVELQQGAIDVYYYPSNSQVVAPADQINYDWTPASVSTAQQGFGNITITSPMDCKHKRDDGDLLYDCLFRTGTMAASEARFALPNGLTVDTSKTPNGKPAGTWERANATNPSVKRGPVGIAPGNGYVTFAVGEYSLALSPFSAVVGTSLASNSEVMNFTARIPIQGWGPANNVVAIDPPIMNPVRLLSGSGTYTPSPGTKWIKIKMVGGGGGGSGGGTSSVGNGGSGGATTFGTSLLTASGGGGGVGAGIGGTGGTTAVNSPAIAMAAPQGASGSSYLGSNAGLAIPGMPGASTPFGGGGGGGIYASTGFSAVANTGAGGGGGGAGTSAGGGSGGGAGGYIEAYIAGNLAASYSYTIGAGGTAGAAGTSANAGGPGGSGFILIEEYFSTWQSMLASGALENILPFTNRAISSDAPFPKREERASFAAGTNLSVCASSPCTVYGDYTAWVASVTRASAGVFDIAFTKPFLNTNYNFGYSMINWNGTSTNITSCYFTNKTTTGIRLNCFNSSGANDAAVEFWASGTR